MLNNLNNLAFLFFYNFIYIKIWFSSAANPCSPVTAFRAPLSQKEGLEDIY